VDSMGAVDAEQLIESALRNLEMCMYGAIDGWKMAADDYDKVAKESGYEHPFETGLAEADLNEEVMYGYAEALYEAVSAARRAIDMHEAYSIEVAPSNVCGALDRFVSEVEAPARSLRWKLS